MDRREFLALSASIGLAGQQQGKWHLGTNDPTRHGFEQFYVNYLRRV